MAGRGRGRGRGMSFSVETLGFGRGEALPGPILQPPPTFPPLEYKPVPLDMNEEQRYLLALKEEYKGAMRESPYYILPANKITDIQRYSDKYQLAGSDNSDNWEPDWSRLPKELKIKVKRGNKLKAVIKPKLLPSDAVSSRKTEAKKEDISKVLEELEKKEQGDNVEESEEEKEKGEDNEEFEEEELDDEEIEEENDYISSYFDNGEEYGDDDDDVDEGPVY